MALGWGVLVIGLAPSSAPAAPAPCSNETVRSQQGAALPDCRAYEMVTPPDKGSGEPEPTDLAAVREAREFIPLDPTSLPSPTGARAAVDGDRMAWLSEPIPGARNPGIDHLSTRAQGGWSNVDIVPRMSVLNALLCPLQLGVSGWSEDLSSSVLDLPAGPPSGFFQEADCGHDEPRLVAGEPERFRNLFLHDNSLEENALVNVTPPDVLWPEPQEPPHELWPASFLAGSDNLSHIVFEEELALTPDAPIGFPGGDELYEWSAGEVVLVTILPDDTPVHGALAGATRNYGAPSESPEDTALNLAQSRHAVSADGRRIFFEAEGALYMREDAERTVQVDASQGPGVGGGGKFMVASSDGSRVFFTDDSRLTGDSTANPGEPDLYEYNADSETLSDVAPGLSEAAGVLGISGAADDGSYVYVVAKGRLTASQSSRGATATAGEANLYAIHNGSVTFIATLDGAQDACDWVASGRCGGGGAPSGLTSRTAGNGRFIGFNSVRSLTGYDNTDSASGLPDLEIFLYDAANDQLACVSCRPDESRPTAGAAIRWPSTASKNASWHVGYPQRNVSEQGQVFFESTEALLPGDNNGRADVYQYVDGGLNLISSGSSKAGSHFLDATPDGSDVFFSTAERLVLRDRDAAFDYYDARTGGGFEEATTPAVACGAGSCREAGEQITALEPGSKFVFGHPKKFRRRCGRGRRSESGRVAGVNRRGHKNRCHRRSKGGRS